MSQELATTRTKEQALRERLRAKLAPGAGTVPRTSALLLDRSGSMRDYLGANTRKIDELRKLARDFQDVRRVQFASTARELVANAEIEDPGGGTAMDVAFRACKKLGISHVIMITDGLPDAADRALDAAFGLRIDIFYVGPDPAPEFLARLADATGGQYGKASLEMTKALGTQVRALLTGQTE